VGGRHIFPLDREVDDHVYCIYEFPAKGYFHDNDPSKGVADPNKKIVVTYSSINGNGFGNYGEVVMGTKGTLILEQETEVMLYAGSATGTSVSVSQSKGGPTLDTTQSGGGAPAAVGQLALSGPVSRGYTEEMEHWAWCIRNESEENKPRCHPKVALGDAVIALTTNIVTSRNSSSDGAAGETGRLKFNPAWFDIDSDETPEGVKPDLKREKYNV
jgi:predicted dehydrogenase